MRWDITDDTQLTLATCESIISHSGVDPEQIAATFVEWHRAHRFSGLGPSTLAALRALRAGAHWALAGAGGEMRAGNGAAMRIAPLALCLDGRSDDVRSLISDVCRITHRSDEARIAAYAVAAAIRGAIETSTPDCLESLSVTVAASLPDSLVKDRLTALSRTDATQSLTEIGLEYGTSAHAPESVPFAILTAQRLTTGEFEATLRAAIAAGGDTDTVGSIAGQIAGAWMGACALPPHLVSALLAEQPNVRTVASDFARAVGIIER